MWNLADLVKLFVTPSPNLKMAKTMRALVIVGKGKIELRSVPCPKPEFLQDGEVIVRNEGVGLNPVDFKIGIYDAFANLRPGGHYDEKKVLKSKDSYRLCNIFGTDGAGTVEASKSKKFKVGDKVWYSGTITKPGSFAEFTIVDSRILAKRPLSVSAAEAAALPLTFQTAWEAMVESMGIPYAPKPGFLSNEEPVDATMLVVNGAGGAGSIGIQLAKNVLNVRTVIATASRDETKKFCDKMGADGIFSHRKPVDKWSDEVGKLKETLEVKEDPGYTGGGQADYVYETHPGKNSAGSVMNVLRAGGRFQTICRHSEDQWGGVGGFDMTMKRLTMGVTFMFSRDTCGYKKQTVGDVLSICAKLVDCGLIKPHLGSDDPPKDMFENWEEAIKKQMSGKAIGKSAFFVEKNGDTTL